MRFRPSKIATTVPFVLGVAAVVVYAVWVLAGQDPNLTETMNWVYNGSLMLAGITCLTQGIISRRARGAWLAFGVGLLSWTAGDVYYTEVLSNERHIPYPSWADAGYLLTLPCFFVGIALLTRERIGQFTLAQWFDGAIGALAAAAVASALLGPALIGLTKGDPATVLTNLAYPLGDVLLIGFIAATLVVSGLRGARGLLAVGAGILVWASGDAVYLYQVAADSYRGGLIDLIWPLGTLFIASGALLSTSAPLRRAHSYRPSLAMPIVFGALAAAVLGWDHYSRIHPASVWLAEATILAVLLRLAVSFRENDRLTNRIRNDSVTDVLTGLGNRRGLFIALEDLLSRPQAEANQYVFGLFDLDGFKFYNDSFGHPAGDALLHRLGVCLTRALADSGVGYRLGGDEFCVLIELRERKPAALVEMARAALSESGEGFSIGASGGWALLPRDAATSSDALHLVDQRMYAEKSERSVRDSGQMQDVFLRMFRDNEPELSAHFEGVARLAQDVGHELELDAEELDIITRAAELHDIGKIAMPDELLQKPGPLDESEWALIRRHTLIGDRILSGTPAMKPVARLVRSSHERWDGEGYPDRLSAEEIPLGARLICICDAYDAMLSTRSYKPAQPREKALAELRRCAGTQFDPVLVETFCRVVEDAQAGESPVTASIGRRGN